MDFEWADSRYLSELMDSPLYLDSLDKAVIFAYILLNFYSISVILSHFSYDIIVQIIHIDTKYNFHHLQNDCYVNVNYVFFQI